MPWIDGKYYYQQQKIYTDEIKFIRPPQTLSNATQMLVVDSSNIIRQQALVNAVGGNNMWYESWHMTTEGISSANKYANSVKKVFYHGFRADTTGEYTNMQVRIENKIGINNTILNMHVAIYDSSNNTTSSIIDSSPHPTSLQGEGSRNFTLGTSDYGTHSYLDIPFDSPIPVTRGNIYFVALFYNDGIDGLFGLGDNLTSSSSYHLSYSSASTSVSSFISTIPSSGINTVEPNPQAAYWFTLYGLQSAAGAIQGPPGPAGPSTGSVSFFIDYGEKLTQGNNAIAYKLLADGNTDNGMNNNFMSGYFIAPHSAASYLPTNSYYMYSGLLPGGGSYPPPDGKPMIYGAYMYRKGIIRGVGMNVHYEAATPGPGLSFPTTITPLVAVYGGEGGQGHDSRVGGWNYNYGIGGANATNGDPPQMGWWGSANKLDKELEFAAGDYIGIYVPVASGINLDIPHFSVEATLHLEYI